MLCKKSKITVKFINGIKEIKVLNPNQQGHNLNYPAYYIYVPYKGEQCLSKIIFYKDGYFYNKKGPIIMRFYNGIISSASWRGNTKRGNLEKDYYTDGSVSNVYKNGFLYRAYKKGKVIDGISSFVNKALEFEKVLLNIIKEQNK
jgi:hypothetical protein